MVLSGQVELWHFVDAFDEPADETLGPGCVFGYSTVLSEAAVGPRAVALGPVRVVQIPRTAVAAVFSTPAGVRQLARDIAQNVSGTRAGPRGRMRSHTVDELVVTEPVLGDPDMGVGAAARRMTESGCGYLAVPVGPGMFGLVTDAVLRERVVAEERGPDTPVRAVMIPEAVTVHTSTPTLTALVQMTGRRLDHLLVVDDAGGLTGAVAPQDFLASSSGAGLVLRSQVERATSLEHLVPFARRLPALLAELLRLRWSAAEATAIYSTVVDAVQRRGLELVLATRPELDAGLAANEVTWLLLGSNARRETVLSSDIDSAVVFADTVPPERAAVYRSVFAEVADVLGRAGIRVDRHGATPSNPEFARTRGAWQEMARQWLVNPLDNQGMLLASLLLDGRPIVGDPGEPVVHEVFADVREHPATLKLLVRESLSHKARLRSVRDVIARRGDTFDLKKHALRPIIEIARWAALSVRSPELAT